MIAPIRPEPWMLDALCAQADPDAWFPERGGSHRYATARTICHECPVLARCLDYAMRMEGGVTAHYRNGMYAGLTPQERARLAGVAA